MDRYSFNAVEGQIGHCGLWCGSCIVGNGLLAEMTRKYKKVVCGHGVQKWGLKEKGDDFVASLHSIEALSVCPGCLKGGGDDTCRMRECTKGKDWSIVMSAVPGRNALIKRVSTLCTKVERLPEC